MKVRIDGILDSAPITGSVSVNGLTLVSGSNLSVFITSSNVIPVSMSNPVFVTSTGSLLTTIVNQLTITSTGSLGVTGSVTVNNLPATQSVLISNTALSITSTGSLGVTGSVSINGLTFVSGSNLSVFITSSNVVPVSMSNPVFVTSTGSLLTTIGNTVNISSTGSLGVTGSIGVNGLTFVSGSNLSVFITGSNVLSVRETDVVNTTASGSNVSGSITTVTLLASNPNRKGATVFNDSNSNLYVHLGSGGDTSNFTVKLLPTGYMEVPFYYSGIITGLWDVATGSARINEVTA